jgi:2-hydroxy-6-oxonona-2,4-dienedioate hydrolase
MEWLSDARLHVIADAGHWPQWEKPWEFLGVHREFLLGEAGNARAAGAAREETG